MTMKKLLSIILAVMLSLSCSFILASCDDAEDIPKDSESETESQPIYETESETQKEIETEPESIPESESETETETEIETESESGIPTGYQLYENEHISFSYPENWTELAQSPIMLINETGIGNCITIASEPYSFIYSEMSAEMFEELYAPVYEAMGLPMTNITVEHLTNENNVDITKVCFDTQASGIPMAQMLFIFASNNLNYVVTTTEVTPMPEIIEVVFETINVKEAETNDDPTALGFYSDGIISFEYPITWIQTSSNPVMFMDNTGSGNNINIVFEDYNKIYDTLTTEMFEEMFLPLYESMGLVITNYSVEHVTNSNGTKIVKISFITEVSGMKIPQIAMVVSSDDYTYSITITEVTPAPDVVEQVFNTLTLNK